jgi:ferredoxin--NADP+ reductase
VLGRAWGFEPTAADTHVFLCGNPAMVEDAMKVLGAQGFIEHTRSQPGQIHVEKYW